MVASLWNVGTLPATPVEDATLGFVSGSSPSCDAIQKHRPECSVPAGEPGLAGHA
jgi:hypothetical protein